MTDTPQKRSLPGPRKRARFILDITHVSMPDSWPREVSELPFEEGVHESDLDLVEKEVPGAISGLLHQIHRPAAGSVPPGLNLSALPVGAVLRRVS